MTLLIPVCTPRSRIRVEGKVAPRSFRAHHSPGVLDPISQRSNCGTAVAARNAGHHGPGAITPRLIQFTIPLPFIPFCVVRTLDTPLVFSIQPFHFSWSPSLIGSYIYPRFSSLFNGLLLGISHNAARVFPTFLSHKSLCVPSVSAHALAVTFTTPRS